MRRPRTFFANENKVSAAVQHLHMHACLYICMAVCIYIYLRCVCVCAVIVARVLQQTTTATNFIQLLGAAQQRRCSERVFVFVFVVVLANITVIVYVFAFVYAFIFTWALCKNTNFVYSSYFMYLIAQCFS